MCGKKTVEQKKTPSTVINSIQMTSAENGEQCMDDVSYSVKQCLMA
jgi:hypothetical protein